MPFLDLIARLKTFGVPGGMLDPTAEVVLIDVARIYAESDSVDSRGGPTRADGATADLDCLVYTSSSGAGSAPVPRREDSDGRPQGITRYILLFAADPGVDAVDVRIDWIAHNGTDLSPARTLRSIARSRPPGGGDLLWRVDAEEIG